MIQKFTELMISVNRKNKKTSPKAIPHVNVILQLWSLVRYTRHSHLPVSERAICFCTTANVSLKMNALKKLRVLQYERNASAVLSTAVHLLLTRLRFMLCLAVTDFHCLAMYVQAKDAT